MILSIDQAQGVVSLAPSGRWTLARIEEIDAELARARLPAAPVTLDGARLEALDTAAALALVRGLAAAGAGIGRTVNLKSSHARVIETVRAQALATQGDAPPRRAMLAVLGFAMVRPGHLVHAHLDNPREIGRAHV